MPKTGSIRVKSNNSTLIPALVANEKAALVSVHNNQVVTTSLRVAEYFGKEHSKVLRAIRMLDCSVDFNQANFVLVTYKDAKGENRPMYYLTRDGFTFLAMGFTGKVAAKFKEAYIEAFNDMERKLQQQQSTRYAEELLHKHIAAFNKRMQYVKGNKDFAAFDCLYPFISDLKGSTLEENLRNMFAQINNAYVSGMYAAGQYIKYEERLRNLSTEVRKLINSDNLYR